MNECTLAEWFKALEDLNNMDVQLSTLDSYDRESIGLSVCDIEAVYMSVKNKIDYYISQQPKQKGLF